MARKRKTRKPLTTTPILAQQQPSSECYDGERLDNLLNKLGRSIETARNLKGEQLPDKIWIKQQFAIGVNDVTRVLERMPARDRRDHSGEVSVKCPRRTAPLVPLQAVLLASDCNPRSLTKHIPSLASSRNIRVISVKDNKGGSLRLGKLVNLKTAIAIGVKVRGSSINQIVDELISCPSEDSAADAEETGSQDSAADAKETGSLCAM